jgi:hypothetical protein
VFAVFFAYQPVEVVVLVAAFDEDIGQDRILIAPYLFVLQAAVIIIFLKIVCKINLIKKSEQ